MKIILLIYFFLVIVHGLDENEDAENIDEKHQFMENVHNEINLKLNSLKDIGLKNQKNLQKDVEFILVKIRFWLEILAELEINWQNEDDEFTHFYEFELKTFNENLNEFVGNLEKAFEENDKEMQIENLTKVFDKEIIWELFKNEKLAHFLPEEMNKLFEKLYKMDFGDKKIIPTLMHFGYELKKINNHSNEEFLEYPEFAQSIHYGKQIRGFNCCNDFHQFICSGFDRILSEKRVNPFAMSQHDMIREHLHDKLLEHLEDKIKIIDDNDKIKKQSKCTEQMLIFYEKCKNAGNRVKMDSEAAALDDAERFANLRTIVEGIYPEVLLKRKPKLDTELLDRTFPFTPFYIIERKEYVKEEMIALKPQSALFMTASNLRTLMERLLKLLHQHGLFGNAIPEKQNAKTSFTLDELIDEVIKLDEFVNNLKKTVSRNDGTMMHMILHKLGGEPIDWIKLLKKKWPDFKLSYLTIMSVEAKKFFTKIHALVKKMVNTGNPLKIQAIAEYMRLSSFWHLLEELNVSDIRISRKPSKCLADYVNKYFPHCLENFLALRELEDVQTREKYHNLYKLTNQIFVNVQREFLQYLQTKADWMGESVRKRALDKIANIKFQIGYNDAILDGDEIFEKYYSNFELRPEMSWPEMLVHVQFKSSKWPFSRAGTKVVAVYDEFGNCVKINRAALHRPYLLVEFGENGEIVASSDAFNYGALGSTIGHEIAHAIDPNGIKKNAKGYKDLSYSIDFVTSTKVVEQFKLYKYNKKIATLKREYKNYWLEKERKDPELTIQEDFADNLGLHMATAAFNSLKVKNEKKIFGLEEFNEKQIFLMRECWKFTKLGRKLFVAKDEHSLPSARVNLSLLNLKEFAGIFNCEQGTKLNPKEGEFKRIEF